ncbi:terminase family protein [Pusillimonas minor]|uniref:Terminase n=1 Tax=Pusillimonas minor TaxID=2697024 RepID=A0A842HMM3_9BURK|nr:terminase family protein [Pusillimonas minor]MBC2768570.1 terminase [Pusillimonas minor]
MPAPNVIWRPLPGSQTSFLTCPIYEALLEGTRGGGKTDALLMSYAQHVGRGFGEHWRGALFRLTYPQLADVVKKSKTWFKRIFPKARFNESDYSWTWPDGEMLLFRYGAKEDDYWNYHGHEYPWLGFEELTNWRSLAFFEAMHSTCRSAEPGMPRMVRATCNPFGVGHAVVKKRYKLGTGGVRPGTVIREDGEKPRVAIHSTITENVILLKNDPEYVRTLQALKDPNRKKAWLEGDWDIHVGAFFESVWNPKRHIVEPFPIPSHWNVWKSMDWGFAAPYCVLWLAMDPDGCIYIWRELYGAGEKEGEGTKEPADKVATKVRKIEEHDERLGYEYRMNLADPSIFSKIGADRSIGQIFKDKGVRWQPAWNARGSVANGSQELFRLLAEGKLKIFSTCKHLIRTLPAIGPDDLDPEKYDSSGEDHAVDALRYGVMRRRRNPEEEQKSDDAETPGHTVDDYGNHRIEPHV